MQAVQEIQEIQEIQETPLWGDGRGAKTKPLNFQTSKLPIASRRR